jgi:hypothetical protein
LFGSFKLWIFVLFSDFVLRISDLKVMLVPNSGTNSKTL